MEALFVLAAIVVLAAPIITLIIVTQIRREQQSIRQQLDALQHALQRRDEERPVLVPKPKPFEQPIEEKIEPPKFVPPPPPPPPPTPKPEPILPKVEMPAPKPVSVTPPVVKKPARPSFFERNPDLEKFIGENLANKIGIGVLVIGIGFFVKYAIDQDWINEIGRVFIGIACGGILLGLAHRMRKTFTAFSSVLVGGGIAVLYLTIFIAFHTYHMFETPVAFLLMIVITGFAVVFSLAYNRIELAIIAVLGGFASPFMVSTGEGNYVALFTYITILDVGMLVLSYFRRWPAINVIVYVLTVLLFGSWAASRYNYETPGMILGTLGFATGFYLIFFAMNLVNNLKERRKFGAFDFAMLLSATLFYYSAGMFVLTNPATNDYRGLFTALLAIFNFGFAYALFKNSKADRNLVFLLIGLVLTFISLAAPVQLEGNYITLFWAAEAVLLLWLSQKSGIQLMRTTSVAVMVLMVISLVMDLQKVYGVSAWSFDETVPEMNIVFNQGYLTCLVAVASLVGTILLLRKESEKIAFIPLLAYRSGLMVALVLLVYFMNWFELSYHLLYAFGDDFTTQTIALGCYNFLFLMVLTLAERKVTTPGSDVQKGFAFIGFLAIVIFIRYVGEILNARDEMILNGGTSIGFWLHYLMVAFVLVICAISIQRMKLHTEFNLRTKNAYSWVYVAFFVFVASFELDNLIAKVFATSETYDHVVTQNHKIGFPILWGLASFLLIAIGLKWKIRHLRIISLTLFLVTLVKLFLVDIRGISEGGKIAAFISLGVLLLVVSFMYQRLKKILLDEPVNPEVKE